MTRRILKIGFLLLCAGVVVLTLSSCGDIDEETVIIELSADKTEVPADGTSSVAITAELTNEVGDPVLPGTEVEFTMAPRPRQV